jgi:hypothetical protein
MKTEMKNGVIDKDKERILFTLGIQPNFALIFSEKNSVLELTNQLTNSMEKCIC